MGYPNPAGYWVGWVVDNMYPTQRWVGPKFLGPNLTQPILTQLVRLLNPLLNIVTINVIINVTITFKPITIRLGGGLGIKPNPGFWPCNPPRTLPTRPNDPTLLGRVENPLGLPNSTGRGLYVYNINKKGFV